MFYAKIKVNKLDKRGSLMKSSTIRRANLTKEKIAVLEALAKYRRQTYEQNSSVPMPIKEKELDVLWQSFKTKLT